MQDPYSERMSAGETRAASGLALVFAFRMLGMFMVLPVLATYGMDLQGATPALIGLAIGLALLVGLAILLAPRYLARTPATGSRATSSTVSIQTAGAASGAGRVVWADAGAPANISVISAAVPRRSWACPGSRRKSSWKASTTRSAIFFSSAAM